MRFALALAALTCTCGGQATKTPQPAPLRAPLPIAASTAASEAVSTAEPASVPAPSATAARLPADPPDPEPAKVPIEPLPSSRFLGKSDLALFNGVCQLRETTRGVGCACCPTEHAAAWCATNAKPSVFIEKVLRGGFSKAGSKEAFATGASFTCGNLSAWGATYFFRHDGTTWQTITTETHWFHVLEASVWAMDDGRDGIVTHDEINKSRIQAVAFSTFGAHGKSKRTELLTWSNADCLRRPAGFFQAIAYYRGSNAFDWNKDGHRDLVVTVEVQRVFADKRFADACVKGANPWAGARNAIHTIPLLFDGTTFTVESNAGKRFHYAIAEVDRSGRPFTP